MKFQQRLKEMLSPYVPRPLWAKDARFRLVMHYAYFNYLRDAVLPRLSDYVSRRTEDRVGRVISRYNRDDALLGITQVAARESTFK